MYSSVEITTGWNAPSAVYSAPRKNNSSAKPFTSVITTTSARLPWLAYSSTRVMCSDTRGNLAGHQPADHEDAAEQQPDASR